MAKNTTAARLVAPETTPTMRELLEEQLEHLRGAIGNVQDWYFGGGTFEGLAFADDVQREACAFAWGYLRGAAEMADVTISDLLDAHDLAFNAELTYRCKCSWLGGDPDIGPRRGTKKPTCPACWYHNHKRVVVTPEVRS